MENSIIFGPIPSRGFGLSLGIDLSPSKKQCNFDCLYCELQSSKTVDSQTDILDVSFIIQELEKALEKHKNIDVITFTANGEPTLYPNLDILVDKVNKIKNNKKTLILSNGANIYKKDIQKTLSKIDIVKLSLDCVSYNCFKKLDRFNSSVECDKIVQGMIEFNQQFKHQLILEILFVKDLNDNIKEVDLLYNAIKQIQPSRVDIGTIDRPPAYNVKSVDYEFLQNVANRFNNIPIVITHKNKIETMKQYFSKNEILNTLQRRPLTKDDIEYLFDDKSKQNLSELINSSEVIIKNNNNIDFYFPFDRR